MSWAQDNLGEMCKQPKLQNRRLIGRKQVLAHVLQGKGVLPYPQPPQPLLESLHLLGSIGKGKEQLSL